MKKIKNSSYLYEQGLSTVGLKRVAEDDHDQQDGPGGSAKRILTEDQARPPLSRGDSLPTVPFAGDRQPNFKDKHPVRAPSFDTATFKAGSKCFFSLFFLLFVNYINHFSLIAFSLHFPSVLFCYTHIYL